MAPRGQNPPSLPAKSLWPITGPLDPRAYALWLGQLSLFAPYCADGERMGKKTRYRHFCPFLLHFRHPLLIRLPHAWKHVCAVRGHKKYTIWISNLFIKLSVPCRYATTIYLLSWNILLSQMRGERGREKGLITKGSRLFFPISGHKHTVFVSKVLYPSHMSNYRSQQLWTRRAVRETTIRVQFFTAFDITPFPVNQ